MARLESDSDDSGSASSDDIPSFSAAFGDRATPPETAHAPGRSVRVESAEISSDVALSDIVPIPSRSLSSRGFVCYRIVRSIKGLRKRLHMALIKDGDPILCTKVLDKKRIPMAAGGEFHKKTCEPIAVIVSSQKNTVFGLQRINSGSTANVMTIQYSLPARRCPREAVADFQEQFPNIPVHLENRKPHRGPNGRWVVNYTGRFADSSVKNCLLVDAEDVEYLVAIKLDKDTMGLEVKPEIPDICAFCLGISSFICHL
jgi:hypothetical protein